MTLDSYIASLRGKRIAVIGVGVSNRPLIELLLRGGCDVTARDKASREKLGEYGDKVEAMGCKFRLGEEYLSELTEDVIFRTPGLHPFTPELAAAKARGAELTSEMEAFFKVCPCSIAAVTGSDGKTTTTTIISELLKGAGYTVHLGGNIGKPLLAEVPAMQKSDWAVLELSSFQLHSMDCRPDRAVITNVSPNHLDIHPSYEDYQIAKKQIFRQMAESGRVILNADNAITSSWEKEVPARVALFSRRIKPERGVYLRSDGVICRCAAGEEMPILSMDEIRIPGLHNVENYMAAFAATEGLVSDEVCCRVARDFAGVAHRLEMLRTLRGVTYCNDSIASSPTRTIAGLRALKQKPILIAGGYDKQIPFEELGVEICDRVKSLYLTGHTAEKIRSAVLSAANYDPARLPVHMVGSIDEAVAAAAREAVEGDLVLLSPACASFDAFANFAQRGDHFRKIVMELE